MSLDPHTNRPWILALVVGDERGGIAQSMLSIADALDAQGIDLVVNSLREGFLTDLALAGGIDVNVVNGGGPLARASRARSAPLRLPASLIVGSCMPSRSGPSRVSRRSQKPLGVLIRQPTLLSWGGKVAEVWGVPLVWYLANAAGPKATPGSFRAATYRFGARRVNARVLANSHYVANTFNFLGEHPVAYVPLQADFFETRTLPPEYDEPHFLSIGRVHPSKGQLELVEAFHRYRTDHGRGTLEIVGLRDDEHSRRLTQRVSMSERQKGISLRGYISDPRSAIDRANIVIVGQTGVEPFGQVAAQSLSRGRPILAVGQGGPAELVQRTGFGWCVRRFEPEVLARGLALAARQWESKAQQATSIHAVSSELFDGVDFVQSLQKIL